MHLGTVCLFSPVLPFLSSLTPLSTQISVSLPLRTGFGERASLSDLEALCARAHAHLHSSRSLKGPFHLSAFLNPSLDPHDSPAAFLNGSHLPLPWGRCRWWTGTCPLSCSLLLLDHSSHIILLELLLAGSTVCNPLAFGHLLTP